MGAGAASGGDKECPGSGSGRAARTRACRAVPDFGRSNPCSAAGGPYIVNRGDVGRCAVRVGEMIPYGSGTVCECKSKLSMNVQTLCIVLKSTI